MNHGEAVDADEQKRESIQQVLHELKQVAAETQKYKEIAFR